MWRRTCSRTEPTSPSQIWAVTSVTLTLLIICASAGGSDKCCDKDDGNDFSPCRSNPCQHGGTCLSYDDAFTCQCKPGYKGHLCEHDSVILSDEKRLIKKLLEDYDHVGIVGRPVHNTSQTIKVGYGLSLIQILDLDEKNQILTTNVWSRYTWTDAILQWDPKQFGGVGEIRVPVHKIWRPDIVLYNYADERLREHRDAMAVVKSDGSVLWLPPVIFRSTCSIDILYFPFDIQSCHMKFGSWTYDGFKLDLDFDDSSEMDITSYTASNEWSLLNYSGKRTSKTYACCAEPYIDITYTIRVMRIPIFYGYTLIIPCILLSLLTLVSFWLPPETPAKMLLGMNLFLAFFLLLKLLASSTPASSNIPLIGAYFCLNMVLITLSSFLSVTVINLYMRADKKNKVPVWIKKIAIDGLSRILCMEQRKYIVKKKPRTRDHVTHHVTHVIDGTSDGRKSHHEKTIKSPVLPYNKWEPQPKNHGGDSPIATHPGGLGFGGVGGVGGPCYLQDRLDQTCVGGEIFETEVKEIKRVLRNFMTKLQIRDAKERIAMEWRLVALAIDRLFFVIYIITITVSTVVIYAMCHVYRDTYGR